MFSYQQQDRLLLPSILVCVQITSPNFVFYLFNNELVHVTKGEGVLWTDEVSKDVKSVSSLEIDLCDDPIGSIVDVRK